MNAQDVERVVRFWFEELSEKDWWGGDDTLDDRIQERFGALHRMIATDIAVLRATCSGDATVSLAHILVLDQFSRNIHRGTAAAFAQDDSALSLATQAVDEGLGAQLPERRVPFLYMPFMHAEDLDAQNRSVELFREISEQMLAYAEQHRDIVKQFGRFPHRNEVLGRVSTPEELAFLEDGPRYGQ